MDGKADGMTGDLLGLLPPIRRIRGNRLYAADGRRFLDLWLDGGRGILGERDRHARMYAANAADKGLSRPYPGQHDARFRKAVLAAWPGWPGLRLYANEERALAAAARVLGSPAVLSEPVSRGGERGSVALLRPFAPDPAGPVLALPRLPCPAAFAPACLLSRDPSLLAGEGGDTVPQMALVAAARALDSLAGSEREGYGPALWERWDRRMAAFFERRGPWLLASAARERYADFFRAALEGGVLVSPVFDEPCLVPPDFDDGELVKLAAALARAGFGPRDGSVTNAAGSGA